MGWSMVVVLGAALIGSAAPTSSVRPFVTYHRAELWQPAWAVLALLLVLAVARVAQQSTSFAAALVILLVGQTWFVVNTALASLSAAGLATFADPLWYGLVVVQAVAGAVAVVRGGRDTRERRRFERAMRRLTRDVARHGPAEDQAPPAWHEGFQQPHS
jgi:hypothetical protein